MNDMHGEPHALYDAQDGIATITLNRPQARNTLSPEMTGALLTSTATAERDESVRCVVLRGAGTCFAAGGDIPGYDAAIRKDRKGHRASLGRQMADWHMIIGRLRGMSKPVLAVVHGTAFGYGLSLVLAADLVLASTDASFMLPHRHIALPPDAGISYLLPRIVGERRALELAFLGGSFDAVKAQDMGIVNWTTRPEDLRDRTAKIARQLAAGPPLALAQAKTLLRTALERDWNTQISAETEAAQRALATNDHVEGVMAFIAKRRATYTGN